MKKLTKWLLLLFMVLCMAAFVLYCVYARQQQDHTPPVISIETDTLTLSVQDGEEFLLTGVSARDDRDGDVTASLVVEGIASIGEDHCATVTYAAFDAAGNVAKAQRTLCYTDYEGPRFEISQPLVFQSGKTVDIFDYVTVTDPTDGDLSNRLRATLTGGDGVSMSTVGTHYVALRVTNSMGDTARLTVPVEVYDPAQYNARVNLSTGLVYLEKGGFFYPKDYLESLYAAYKNVPLSQLLAEGADIQIDSDVRYNTPGTYSVTYTVTYGSYSGISRLIVIVEE